MGCGYEGFCRTCRKRVWLGYGSARTWARAFKTALEFDVHKDNARMVGDPAVHIQSLRKNANMRGFIAEHEGHDFEVVNDDYVDPVGDDIVDCGSDHVRVAEGNLFERESASVMVGE